MEPWRAMIVKIQLLHFFPLIFFSFWILHNMVNRGLSSMLTNNWNCYNIDAEAWLACICQRLRIGIVNTYKYTGFHSQLWNSHIVLRDQYYGNLGGLIHKSIWIHKGHILTAGSKKWIGHSGVVLSHSSQTMLV